MTSHPDDHHNHPSTMQGNLRPGQANCQVFSQAQPMAQAQYRATSGSLNPSPSDNFTLAASNGPMQVLTQQQEQQLRGNHAACNEPGSNGKSQFYSKQYTSMPQLLQSSQP